MTLKRQTEISLNQKNLKIKVLEEKLSILQKDQIDRTQKFDELEEQLFKAWSNVARTLDFLNRLLTRKDVSDDSKDILKLIFETLIPE